jgi:hypothetical protein
MLSARSGGLGTDTGSSKKTIMLSPVKRSSTPAWAAIRRPISAWYSRRTSSTSSGSAVSEKAVKPRRSMKTTVTCRWHSSWRLPRGRLTSRRAGTDLRGQTQRRVARERHRTISAPALAEASDVRGPIGYDAGWVRVTADNAKIASPKRTSHAAPATATSHQRFQTKRGRQSCLIGGRASTERSPEGCGRGLAQWWQPAVASSRYRVAFIAPTSSNWSLEQAGDQAERAGSPRVTRWIAQGGLVSHRSMNQRAGRGRRPSFVDIPGRYAATG